MKLDYPFSPRADWRLAVSRRFNHPTVDSLYASIQPVLEKEGVLMECTYASDQAVDDDFWMNRIDLILELAELHILVDIEKSPNMEFEFERSARISRFRKSLALARNLAWAPMTTRALIRPITIVIKQGRSKDRLVKRRRTATLYFADQDNLNDLAGRLESAISWAKRHRLVRLHQMKNFLERRIRFLGLAGEDLEFCLVKMTELARRIKEGQGIDDLLPTAEEIEAKERTTRQRVNEQFEWSVKLKKGEVEIPARFIDTYVLLRDHSRDTLAAVATPELANFFLVRWLISIGSLLKTVKIRKRKRANAKRPDSTPIDPPAQPESEPAESQTIIRCLWCERLQAEVPILVEKAPLYICSDCVHRYLQTLDEVSLPTEETGPCGFCNNTYADTARIVERQGSRICNVCLNICLEVVTDDSEAAV